MKKSFAVIAASLAIFGSTGISTALAADVPDGPTELVLEQAGDNWALSLSPATGASPEVISDALRGDMGTIVDSNAADANYVKYQGLGTDDGLATAVMVSGGSIEIAWQPEASDSTVSVVVNGEPIAVEGNASSVSVEEQLGAPVNVSVVAISKEASSTTGLISSEFAQLSVTTPTTLSAVSNTIAAFAVALPAKTTFRQNAFIPDDYILMYPPNICSPFGSYSFRFVGDNRGYSPNDGASFRTRMDVGIVWVATPSVTFTKLVGTTIRQMRIYDIPPVWIEDERRTASAVTMNYNFLSSSSSYVRFQITQDVVNPFCNIHEVNGITSNTTISVYRTGAVSGVIDYLAMPNYEIYLRQDTSPYSTIAQFQYQSPFCLVKQLADPFCNQSVTLRN